MGEEKMISVIMLANEIWTSNPENHIKNFLYSVGELLKADDAAVMAEAADAAFYDQIARRRCLCRADITGGSFL